MPNDVSPIAATMKPVHSSAQAPVLTQGRRDFFTYRDLGVKDGSAGKMRAQLMKAKEGMTSTADRLALPHLREPVRLLP